MQKVGMPHFRWLPNPRPSHHYSKDGTTTGQSAQVRVNGRRRCIVCGLDEVVLVTTARGTPLVITPTGG